MEKLIELICESTQKLTKYEILTNLVPGTVLCYILNYIGFSLLSADWWFNVVLFYIVGLANSRFSSIVIEWICRKLKIVESRKYEQYNKVKESKPFVATLQETANMYRSLSSVFILATLAKLYKVVSGEWYWLDIVLPWVVLLGLVALFLLSYRKQVKYIIKQIDSENQNNINQ